ncbi:MAG: N-acetyltransferase, partial [Rhodospirillales bacterium]|nr:N-acetyltransferase [Rhodospirillales bacterium]
VRYWPINIGKAMTPALLLGPLAVDPDLHGAGIGAGLITLSLAIAGEKGHMIVLLVGDMDYYGRFGFTPAAPKGITMGTDTNRLLVLELGNTGAPRPSGDVTRARAAALT